MEEAELKRIEERNLPWFYKLVLKIPGTGFLENAGGIFWAILAPIFLMAESFLSMYLLLAFSFPTNIILTSVVPAATFLLFLKISLKRFMNWWNAMCSESGFEWNIEKTLDDYISLLRGRAERSEEKS